MRYKVTDETFIVLLYILSAIMLVGQFFQINILTSIAFALSFVVVFISWVLLLKKCSSLDVLAIIIIIASLFGAIITCKELSISYFNNWMMFSSVFLYFSVCMKLEIDYTTASKLFKINTFVSFASLLSYIICYDNAFRITNTGIKYLKFGFYNPNTLAVFLLCLLFFGVSYLSYYLERKHWIIEICYFVFFSIMIVQTLSRTAFLALLLFVIIYIIFRRSKNHYVPQSRLFNLTVVVFPLLFAVFYLLIIDSISQNGIFGFLISEGKELDSRQTVWQFAVDLFKQSPICGSYGDMMTSSLFSQMHNTHLNVLASYGIVVFVLVMFFLYIVLSKLCVNCRSSGSVFAAWAFIICLILGAGEAILFSGGLSFYLLVGQFLLLGNASKDKVLL